MQRGIAKCLLRHKLQNNRGELRIDRAKRFKDPDAENRWLRKVASDLTTDSSISRDAGHPLPIERRRAVEERFPVGIDRPVIWLMLTH